MGAVCMFMGVCVCEGRVCVCVKAHILSSASNLTFRVSDDQIGHCNRYIWLRMDYEIQCNLDFWTQGRGVVQDTSLDRYYNSLKFKWNPVSNKITTEMCTDGQTDRQMDSVIIVYLLLRTTLAITEYFEVLEVNAQNCFFFF